MFTLLLKLILVLQNLFFDTSNVFGVFIAYVILTVWGVGGYFYSYSDIPGAVLKCLSQVFLQDIRAHTADFTFLS